VRTNSHPLRKIVGYVNIKTSEDSLCGLDYEVFECGHYAPPKQDIVGEYAAKKRRCHKCGKGKDRQLSIEEVDEIKRKHTI